MFSVLSPAKRLDYSMPDMVVEPTEPILMKDTEILHKTVRRLSQKKLAEAMNLSPDLARLTHERFQAFGRPETESLPSVLAFNGDTYTGLDARTLDHADLRFAQGHVGILSGLFGVLRPLDDMQPYRLEMGTKVKTRRGTTLYDFWGDRVTKEINRRLADQADPTLINLASVEYFKVVQPKRLKAPIITPVFKDVKDGKSRTVSFLAKRARGMMARFIINNRIDTPEDLKSFDEGGYTFDPEQSSTDRWVFEREQPPPVG